MLLIARRTALGAALLLVMPPHGLAVWLAVAARTTGGMAEKPLVGDGNGDPAVGNHHPCCAVRLVSLVPALSPARGADPVPHSCRRHPGGTGAKSWVKARVQEPRPFVIWLENTRQVPVTQFYALKRKERAKLVHEQLAQAQDIPAVFTQTLAERDRVCLPVRPYDVRRQLGAARCRAVVAARRRWGTIAVLLAWATAVMGSRLALGMHWPLDLIVATLISWVLVTVACWLTQRLCGPLSPPGEEAQDIKKTDA